MISSIDSNAIFCCRNYCITHLERIMPCIFIGDPRAAINTKTKSTFTREYNKVHTHTHYMYMYVYIMLYIMSHAHRVVRVGLTYDAVR